MIAPEAVPYLPRGVRLHHDHVRDRWVLLAPERTISLDMIGHAIITELDGGSSFSAIVDRLAAKYDAPSDQISGDVQQFLGQLAERRFLEVRA